MRTEFPVADIPHSFAQPTIYDWGGIEEGVFDGSRLVMSLRINNKPKPMEAYVKGGLHMTGNAFVPNTFLKDLTATEYSGKIKLDLLKNLSVDDINAVQEDTYTLGYSPRWRDMMDPLEEVYDLGVYVPWFLKCNPDRYPYWYGRPDPRNTDLSTALKKSFGD